MASAPGGTAIADVFISYSRADIAAAKRYAAAFEAEGFSVWWDAELRPGEVFDEVIEAALKAAKAVVVLWSPRSVTSRWVRAEATLADRNKTLVPAIIEACERPIIFEMTQTADLCHWDGAADDVAWRGLVGEVRALVGVRTAPAGVAPVPVPKDTHASILVLPFVNMSGDPEQEYFSDGVTEDIITDLGRVSALSVVSRNTAFSYKGRPVVTADLAESLGVSHILEGSVRKSGERVRITAQLLDAHTDAQVWGERFDRTLDDIFAIQDEISGAITGALKVKLAPAEKKSLAQKATADAEAYSLYLRARQFSRTGSERVKPLVVRLCRRAVELDPGFGHAWAMLAFAEVELAQRAVHGYSFEVASEAAAQAVKVAPDLAEAHAAMAEVVGRGVTLNMSAAEGHIDRALALDPDCYEANLFAGYIALEQRKDALAIQYFEAAIAIDPTAYRPACMVVQAYMAIGREEDRIAAARRAVGLCERLLALEPDHSGALGFLVASLAELGESDRAREWAGLALLYDPDDVRLHYNVACGLAVLKDVDGACDLLDGVVDRVNGAWMDWMEVDNSLDPIRDTDRFKATMVRGRSRMAAEEAAE